jgi:hypothetical protein
LLLTVFLFGPFYLSFSATNSELADEIPPLRPPRGELPPGFWEQNGTWISVVAVLLLAVASVAVWIFRRPRVPAPLPPDIEAREALGRFAGKAETGEIISKVSAIVKRYFSLAFDLPRDELTTSEFVRASAQSGKVGAELASRIESFLRDCDQRKFTTPGHAQPPWILISATRLIELGEQRREYLRFQEKPQEPANATRES